MYPYPSAVPYSAGISRIYWFTCKIMLQRTERFTGTETIKALLCLLNLNLICGGFVFQNYTSDLTHQLRKCDIFPVTLDKNSVLHFAMPPFSEP